MSELSRRGFLGATAAAAGAAVIGAALPATDAQASPTSGRGDIRDIKHVVILMQENRSFDQYFGSLKGVRGFGDRATITLPGGLPVLQTADDAARCSRHGHPVPVAPKRRPRLCLSGRSPAAQLGGRCAGIRRDVAQLG